MGQEPGRLFSVQLRDLRASVVIEPFHQRRIHLIVSEMHLPLGFSAAGVACGIKSDPSKLDLALFLSDRPASAAGVFTQNQVVGAPVKVSRSRVPTGCRRSASMWL